MTLAQLWAFVAFVLPALVSVALIEVADLAYQVRAGDIMLRTHTLIRTDSFSFTAAGHAWLDQQWLAQVLFAAVYRPFGWPGRSS